MLLHIICIIHSSYLITGFRAGNIFLNIFLVPVNYTLSGQHFYFQRIQCFIMAMPPNILILYVILSKLTMSIIYIYIYLSQLPLTYIVKNHSKFIILFYFVCHVCLYLLNIKFFCLYSFHVFGIYNVFCIYNVLRASRKMGECSLGLPS